MHIQKLEFFINPTKLYAYLNQGKRKDNLVMLQDATEKGYTIVAYGSEVCTSQIAQPDPDIIREVCANLSWRLKEQDELLNDFLETYPLRSEIEKLPFLYGLIGFFSYDLGLGFEKITSKCLDDRGYPSYYFVVPEEVVIIDHENKAMWVLHAPLPDSESDLDFYENLRTIHFKEPLIMVEESSEAMNSNLTEDEYMQKIDEVKGYLERGETYQVNFSQRFVFQSLKSPWEVYKEVTKINPSKYQGFLVGQDFCVISNSPERLFRICREGSGRKIETRPIKGTIGIKGYESEEELKVIGKRLFDSKKDQAELEMIVDMSRNDLGRVCEFGTIEVDEHRVLGKYSHLLHTVSNVSGLLRKDVDLYDVLRAVFPGASITGCPKKRTMEIIDRLEEYSRGVYCGSLGYLDCRGSRYGGIGGADFNIMIRTLFCKQTRAEAYAYVMHSGGGIVIDSQPGLEFNETFDKVNAFVHAIQSD